MNDKPLLLNRRRVILALIFLVVQLVHWLLLAGNVNTRLSTTPGVATKSKGFGLLPAWTCDRD